MTRTLPWLSLALALAVSPARAQDTGAPPRPEETDRSLLWLPAVTGALAGVVFMAATLDAAGDDEFGAQRELARACLRDPEAPACSRLTPVGFAYANAADPRHSICDPEVAGEYRITEQCESRAGVQRRYRVYLSLSVIGFALSIGTFIGYLVRAKRSPPRGEARSRLQPWLTAGRDGTSGGLNLRLAF